MERLVIYHPRHPYAVGGDIHGGRHLLLLFRNIHELLFHTTAGSIVGRIGFIVVHIGSTVVVFLIYGDEESVFCNEVTCTL